MPTAKNPNIHNCVELATRHNYYILYIATGVATVVSNLNV